MSELTIHYEGYWQCRQATDPDPSDDPRGASGYTFAVGAENDLDMTIRLQQDEIDPVDFRLAPAPKYHPGQPQQFGVFVSRATVSGDGGQPLARNPLKDGKVRWLSQDDPRGGPPRGPRFELRNTITYHPLNQQGIFMPIVPFILSIESPDGEILIRRDDPLDLTDPAKQVWEMDLEGYRRRCPQVFYGVSDAAMEAVGVSLEGDNTFEAYFQARKDWLLLQRAQTTSALEREAFTTRIYAIDNDIENPRMTSRLGLLAQWDHTLRGHHIEIKGENLLGVTIDRQADWQARYWMGGYDGDVMRGYMRGSLSVPLLSPQA